MTKGRNLVKYIDLSVIRNPHKRKQAERKLARQKKKAPKKPKLVTVRLVLHDGQVTEWEVEV